MTPNRNLHSGGLRYGWVILAVSTLTVMGSLGLARFGYTVILPPMQTAMDLNNTQTGALATGNFLGYLALGVIGGFVASRYGPRRVIAASMLLTGLTMALTGAVNSFQGAMLWRTMTGVGSGGSNVPVMSLLPAWFATRRRGLATGIAVSGNSLGLITVGLLVPHIVSEYGQDGWRYSWFVIGAAVLLFGLLAAVLLRDCLEEMGQRPIGTETGAASLAADVPESEPEACGAISLDWKQVYRSGVMWHLALVYTAFGLSYVIYATFFVKYLQTEGGYTGEGAGNLWAVVGWTSVFCGLLWGAVSDRIGRKYGLALVYLIQTTSYALFSLWQSPVGFTVSAVAFGLTAWSIPSIVAAACGDYVGARMAPAALGFLTLFFGLGQAAGPSVAGALADATGSLGPAFQLAAAVAFLGGAGSLLLRPPQVTAGR
jgi:MFS family permease